MSSGVSGFDRHKLKAAREALGYSSADVARLAGIAVATYRHWEDGSTLPTVARLKKAADALNVKLATLIDIPLDRRYLSYYRNISGFTLPELALRMGMATSTLGDIETALTPLNDKTAAALATHLGVSVDELKAAHRRAHDRPPGVRA